jgi:hypothetical protein
MLNSIAMKRAIQLAVLTIAALLASEPAMASVYCAQRIASAAGHDCCAQAANQSAKATAEAPVPGETARIFHCPRPVRPLSGNRSGCQGDPRCLPAMQALLSKVRKSSGAATAPASLRAAVESGAQSLRASTYEPHVPIQAGTTARYILFRNFRI